MDGLILPLGWLVHGGFFAVFVKCLMVCPVIPQLLGLVVESRWVPWHWRRQFLAFMPGNVFLAAFIAACSTTFEDWTPSFVLMQLVLVGAFVFYVALNIMDLGPYTKDQLRSATKVYHNSLYFWYGWLAIMAFSGMAVSDASLTMKVVCSLPGLVWLSCLIADNLFSEEVQKQRFAVAHASNCPIWKRGFKLRRLRDRAYV